MKILDRIGSWLIAGIVFIGGLLFLLPKKEKWQERAVENEEKNVKKSLDKAKAANKQAKVHDDEANKIKSDAEKDAKSDQSTGDILDKWRGS